MIRWPECPSIANEGVLVESNVCSNLNIIWAVEIIWWWAWHDCDLILRTKTLLYPKSIEINHKYGLVIPCTEPTATELKVQKSLGILDFFFFFLLIGYIRIWLSYIQIQMWNILFQVFSFSDIRNREQNQIAIQFSLVLFTNFLLHRAIYRCCGLWWVLTVQAWRGHTSPVLEAWWKKAKKSSWAESAPWSLCGKWYQQWKESYIERQFWLA